MVPKWRMSFWLTQEVELVALERICPLKRATIFVMRFHHENETFGRRGHRHTSR
jgi:hypothetical protein